MVFSSPAFLFLFLPVTVAFYGVCPRWARNAVILTTSLVFYATGQGANLLLLLYYIGWNWAFGTLIGRASERKALAFLVLALTGDLLGLLYFKYGDFLLELVQSVASVGFLERTHSSTLEAIPLGISFFSFQAMSYVIDVYRRTVAPTSSLIEFATYKSFFPQVIAGPIVRYAEVKDELRKRVFDVDGMFEGIVRFTTGLAMKVLIADPLAAVATDILKTPPSQLSTALVWVAMWAYTFQIYFDFAGYSAMAIGLARMFGFHFPENFNVPYSATSVTDFWRRWHMTLTRWFRDYVYIPLGGNRHGPLKTARNLVLVFALCGMWHGAALQFLVWGLYHGALLSIERVTKWDRIKFGPVGRVFRTALTLLLVVIGWVFFRAENLDHAVVLLQFMAGLHEPSVPIKGLAFYLTADKLVIFVVAAVLSLNLVPMPEFRPTVSFALKGVAAIGLLILSAAAMSESGFSPFIYFQF
jgi:alginate O-acetyltransferase complex protein AlgI